MKFCIDKVKEITNKKIISLNSPNDDWDKIPCLCFLFRLGELDNNLLPVGKEMIKYEDDENEWEDHEMSGQARPGTTKRKQYYQKKIADALVGSPAVNKKCYLYYFNMSLTCPITEEQNTRGRKIHGPDETPRGFGILASSIIPLVRYIFPYLF